MVYYITINIKYMLKIFYSLLYISLAIGAIILFLSVMGAIIGVFGWIIGIVIILMLFR
jgi:hypothetical protein